MARFIRKSSKKSGEIPGTLVHIGEVKTDRVAISLIDYDATTLDEMHVVSAEECLLFKDKPTVTWVNVNGLHDVEIIEKLGKSFDLHPLVLEDIVHTGQRAKVDDYENYEFIVLRMLSYNEEMGQIGDEQVSFILGPTWLLSFQEHEGDVFDSVRRRLRSGKGRIRKAGADYLAYALLDAVIDHYFVVLEKLGDRVESVGEEVAENPRPDDLEEIRHLKRELLFLRKSVWPLREVLSGLQRGESPLFEENTLVYLRDVYDHAVQVIDTVENFRDMTGGILDVYHSSLSNRMNEVMKVLTIIATIFIPLSFVAGLYGMNFLHMPELKWRFGYPVALGLMAAVAGGMLFYFRRKKWL
jgi:magnesium transporter